MRRKQVLALPFLPALCVFPVWFTIGMREDMFNSSFSKYYPMVLAMVVGSMIAGSTPLGGGIVAFPVSVLILGFSPDQGRDFSLLIQSVGMTAASYLIFVKKRHLLKEGSGDLLLKFCVLSIIGMIIGFEELDDVLSPYVVNIVYTTTVTCIVIILAYADFLRNNSVRFSVVDDEEQRGSGSSSSTSYDDNEQGVTMKVKKMSAFMDCFALPFFALSGGILSSQIGTGADIACYSFGSLYNDMILSKNSSQKIDEGVEGNIASHGRISENALTAMSVIVMANTSIFGSILRTTTTQILEETSSAAQSEGMAVDEEVFSVLFACAPIVVLGAPIGSLLLTPSNQRVLKRFFYALGVAQFVSFGVIKIGNDFRAWIPIANIILAVCSIVFIHYLWRGRDISMDDSTIQGTKHSEKV